MVAFRTLHLWLSGSATSAVTAWTLVVLGTTDKRIAMETATIENLTLFVVNGNHLEEFLLVTLSAAGRTLSSLQAAGRQFRFRNDRSGAVEVGSNIIHGGK